MINEKIKKIALACGFNLKKQPTGEMDLNPYVYDFARELIKQQSAWISVNDALPEKDGMYLTYTQSAEYTGIDLTSFTDGKFRENLALNEVVTHWQSLPEPPKSK